MESHPSPHEIISGLAARASGLKLLVLHGSRARGEARATSDWDLAYLADSPFDPLSFLADVVLALGTDRVDLSRLSETSGLFRYRVARDGEILFEARKGLFADFWLRAVSFWCDAEPILERSYDAILEEYRQMPALDRQILAEKAAAIERHLQRVASRLPADSSEFKSATDAADVVILHLWQAVQLTIDLALAACLRLDLGTPENYGDAFTRLLAAGFIEEPLARRLVKAAGFRNQVAHAYGNLDMPLVYGAAKDGPGDLRAFMAALLKLA